MRERISTLYLDANGVGPKIVFVDTVLRGLFRYSDGDPPPKWLRRYNRVNLLFAELRDANSRLSYVADWRDAFLQSPWLDVELCNINNLLHLGRCLLGIRKYDLIIISHAAAGDDMALLTRIGHFLHRRRGKIVMFIGNEYDLLDDKLAFISDVEPEYVCSQLPISAARYLYREGTRCEIVEMPHALNPASYRVIEGTKRNKDIGFIGDLYWPFVGDRERTDLIEWFERNGAGHGLQCDIRKVRVTREEWNAFLNTCKGVIGAESGTYYLNERGRLLERARKYNLFENPAASFDEVFDKFYRNQQYEKSGKSISSRHFEPIGTKTCQLLIEGHYNGILQPDIHYIAIKRDLSNLPDAIARFRDESCRSRITKTAYDYVLSEHTYAHRVERLWRIITKARPNTRTGGCASTRVKRQTSS